MALGYGGKEFSTQDIIDRLGIVDIGQVTEIVTPLRSQGLIERTKNHFQANQNAKRLRIPKREVPTFRVVESQQPLPAVPATIAEAETETGRPEHRLFLTNLDFEVTKEELVTLLGDYGEVLSLSLPKHYGRPDRNRGFAFATIASEGSTESIINKVDGLYLRSRRLHALPHR